jgi:aspartyl-tRNA(Asn)/glutamyl-tRNA(Gln) amidotransferase subunit C
LADYYNNPVIATTQWRNVVNRSDIEKLAHLARLNVEGSQLDEVAHSLSNILAMVDQLKAVDTTGVEPMAHPLSVAQRLRADNITESNQREAFLAIAPHTEGGLYLVPKVIE